MLSRPGSTTSSNLQRTKSTTSVQERRKHPLQAKPIDPQTARTHALIAAHRAVDRSRSSVSTDIVRSESILSTKSLLGRHEQCLSFSPATHLKRQRSTLQTRVPRLADTLQIPGEHDVPAQYQTQNDFNYETLFGISSETYGAEPSSYRKLRRSKSSLSPVRRSNHGSDGTIEICLSQVPTLRTAQSQTTLHSQGLKLRVKRSLNFLRSKHAATSRIPTAPVHFNCSTACSPEAIVLARNQYFEGISQQEMPKKASMLFSHKGKQTGNVPQKIAHELEETAIDSNKPGSVGNQITAPVEKRSFSASISDRVKKLFGRSRQDDGIPPQQLEASRPHFGVGVFEASPDAGFDSYLEPDTPLTKRSSLCIPTNHALMTGDNTSEVIQHLSPSDSCQSLVSQSKSRVTSWTDSTVTGSVSVRPGTVEQKRLSIIKEDGGPHQPSCSAGRHIGGVAAFQRPLTIPEGQTVDSQQVYSALIKRIDDEQKEMELTQAALKEIHDAQDQDEIVGHYLFSAPTIRRVTNNDVPTHGDTQETKSDDRIKLPSQVKARIISSSEDLRTTANSGISHASTQPSPLRSLNKHRDKTTSSFRQDLESERPRTDLNSSRDLKDRTNIATDGTNMVYGTFGNKNLSRSTNSVYSRTTNGGINADYIPPILSTADFATQMATATDMATIMYASGSPNRCLPNRDGARTGGATPSKGAWQDWMEHQKDKALSTRASLNPYGHIREHAQIDPDDTTIGHTTEERWSQPALQVSLPTPKSDTLLPGLASLESLSHNNSVHGRRRSSSPFLQLKEVSQDRISAAIQTARMKRSQTALLDQTNKEEVTTTKNTGSLHTSTSSHIASMLKGRKSRPAHTNQLTPGKENSPIHSRQTPPLSTPGRYRLNTHGGNITSQLRKGRSAMDLQPSSNELDASQDPNSQNDSPSHKLKSSFSARLSRPFDMDIPERNRPFDSMYLGKREMGNGSRLSVATSGSSVIKRQPKTYGNLGLHPLRCDDSTGEVDEGDRATTALPTLYKDGDAPRSVSGRSFSQAGKRIVSSFLRGRVKHGDEVKAPPGESPAFI